MEAEARALLAKALEMLIDVECYDTDLYLEIKTFLETNS